MNTPSTKVRRGTARRTIIRQEILRRMETGESLSYRDIRIKTGGSHSTIQEEILFLTNRTHESHLTRLPEREDVVAALEGKLNASQQREGLLRERIAALQATITGLEATIDLLKSQPAAEAATGAAGVADALAELRYLVDRAGDSHRALMAGVDAIRQMGPDRSQSATKDEVQESSEVFLLKAKNERLVRDNVAASKTIERLRARLAAAGLDDS